MITVVIAALTFYKAQSRLRLRGVIDADRKIRVIVENRGRIAGEITNLAVGVPFRTSWKKLRRDYCILPTPPIKFVPGEKVGEMGLLEPVEVAPGGARDWEAKWPDEEVHAYVRGYWGRKKSKSVSYSDLRICGKFNGKFRSGPIKRVDGSFLKAQDEEARRRAGEKGL
ncbi:hypothetical protein [Streptomyces sp. NPDC026092]|uniref:hypothetical protein n=1 Tax=Streptomyces sp. NPDC026092 TaxID=3154797 RepID=UPI0033CBC411